jgi:glycosyltransferase involved in cell wall biosynthesis
MISVVIPVYRNSANIAALLTAVEDLNRELEGDLEAVFVVDGSPDDSYLQLSRELPRAGFRSQLLSLSRNFGAFSAIRAGLEAASADYFAVMAADLQEPPELIVQFYERLRSGDYDVAVGQRDSREDTSLSSGLFWRFYRRFVQPDLPVGGVDVFGCNRAVRDQLVELRETNSSLVGLLFWVGFRRVSVPYARRAREVGVSGWTFAKKVRYLTDSIFSFSDLPIKVLLRLGLFGLLLSFVFGCAVLWWKLFSDTPVPGYAATALLIMFFGTLNCFGLGVIGLYVWHTFENTKGRPGYIVATHLQFGPLGASNPE